MCGIVGLFIKDPSLEPELGRLTAAMLATLSDRGPDSAGFAVYGAGKKGETKLTLRAASAAAMKETADKIGSAFSDANIMLHDSHAVVALDDRSLPRLMEWLAREAPDIEVVGRGRRMEIYKEVGRPETVAERFDLAAMTGTHAIGHTRMATEVGGDHRTARTPSRPARINASCTTARCRTTTPAPRAEREGFNFETENDTEVAAGYLSWKMREGLALGDALKA